MTYRSEDEALRARVDRLEGDLADARRTIARLRGEPAAAPKGDQGIDRFTGVPRYLEREIELPFAVSDEGLVAIADHLSAKVPGGTASQIASTLTHKKGSYEMRIVRTTDGRTTVRLTGDYRPARFQLGIGTPGLALIGAVFAAIAAAGLKLGGAGIAIGGILGAIAGFLLLRELMRRALLVDRLNLIAAFEGVLELARANQAVRARIVPDQAEAEAEAIAEAQGHADAEVDAEAKKARRGG